MDAPIPLPSNAHGLSPADQRLLRWLPRLHVIMAVLLLLWAMPSWWIVNNLFAGMPAEARPPAPWADMLPYLSAAIPVGMAVVLLIAAICLARRCGYVACMIAAVVSCLTIPAVILGVPTLVLLTRPPVKALFGRDRP